MQALHSMRHLAFAALFLSLLCPVVRADANDTDAAKEKDIRKLMELTGSGKLGTQVASQMIQQFRTQMPKVPQEFWDEFAKEIKADDIVNMIVPIYAKHFSDDEIRELIKFYESPIGKKLVAEQPGIVQESMSVGQVWGRKLAARVIQQLKSKGYLPQA